VVGHCEGCCAREKDRRGRAVILCAASGCCGCDLQKRSLAKVTLIIGITEGVPSSTWVRVQRSLSGSTVESHRVTKSPGRCDSGECKIVILCRRTFSRRANGRHPVASGTLTL